MIAVIFELTPAEGRTQDYLDLAAGLKQEVEGHDGFISIERFQSLSTAGKYVSISFWRDEESVKKWRNVHKHRQAQAEGRGGIFASYRLRVATVERDYTKEERTEAPNDSVAVHG